jgi:hypothetical protein
MPTTSASLLVQLRRPDQSEAWARFVQLYSPILYTGAPAKRDASLSFRAGRILDSHR